MRNVQRAVDVPEIDEEHAALFRLCSELESAFKDAAPAREVESLVANLKTRSQEHFAHEEREMRSGGYAHYGWHRRQHQAARAKLKLLERGARSGDREAARDAAVSLNRWLHDHIAVADRMLGAFLRNRRRA